MKRNSSSHSSFTRLHSLIAALILLCLLAFMGCEDAGTPPNGEPCDPTQVLCTNIEDWCALVDAHADVVETRLSIDPKPFVFEPTDLATVLEQTGCTRALADEGIAAAEALCQKASQVEPAITRDVVSSVAANQGTLYGLDHRMKQPTSLARKLISEYTAKKKEDPATTFDTIAATINDSVRFTAIFDLEDLTQSFYAVDASLKNKGYTRVSTINFFEIYESNKESRIKAVHTFYQTEAGFTFELQFQTVDTQSAYDLTHIMYEKGRADTTSAEERKSLYATVREIYACAPSNEAVQSIPPLSE